MSQTITCIACPLGCSVEVSDDLTTSGHKCKNGIAYAVQEVTRPVRVITASVKVAGGDLPLVSVKSSAPVPKARIIDIARLLRKMQVAAPIQLGQVLLKDVCSTSVDIVATREICSSQGKPTP